MKLSTSRQLHRTKMILIVLIFALVLLLAYLLNLRHVLKVYYLNISIIESSLPIIGHARTIFGLNEEGEKVETWILALKLDLNLNWIDFPERLLKLTNIFLSNPRMGTFWYGPVPVLGLAHPDLIKIVLNSDVCLEKSRYFYKMYELDDSLISAPCKFLSLKLLV